MSNTNDTWGTDEPLPSLSELQDRVRPFKSGPPVIRISTPNGIGSKYDELFEANRDDLINDNFKMWVDELLWGESFEAPDGTRIDPVNVGTIGHCDYGKSVVQEVLETLEVIDKMDKRKILVVCAGMGFNTGILDELAAMEYYLKPEPIALAATERRYWVKPHEVQSKPLPKPLNVPYYRRYDRKRHR